MDCLCTIVGKVAEYTVEPLRRLVGYLIHYNQNLQNLSTQVQNLSNARDRVTHQVAEAERRGEQIYDAVQEWLDAVDLIIKETKEFLKGKCQATGELNGPLKDENQANEVLKDEHQVKMKCLHEFCPNPRLRYQISRKSTKLKGVVDELYRKKDFSTVTPEACLQATEDYESIVSRNSIVRKIIDELRSPSADVILVYGVGGVGKTTLVEEVFRQVLKAKLFIDAVMVRDVKVPNLEAIQKEIAEKLGLTVSSDQTIPERADSICERIKQKSTLVILDDLWGEIDFKALGLPHIPTCKIVLTSRFRKLLSSAKIKQKHFLLGVLEENETWLLFKKKAGDVTNDPVIQNVATQVAGRCGGLPVLVITVARALENGPLAMWEDALRCLASFDEKEDLTSKAYLGLEWSYTQLNEQLKPLFLLCGTTIQGNSVSLTNLLKYSMGLGFFKRLTVKEARDALYTRVDKLKSYCLLLDGDDDTCVRMDDLVHDVALRIATRDQHVLVKDGDDQLIEWPDQDSFERCRKIITRSCNIPNFPEAPWKCRELEMFLLHGNENDHRFKIPDKLFDEMQKLKVLGFYNLLITLLPPSLELLKISLQTLCLDGCTLEDIALVGELSSLETLSFANSKVKELPKEIARLTRLRLLDLSDCHMLKVISPNVISSLTRLEDLRMRNSFETWEAEGDINERRNASLLELKQLPKLTALEIYIPDVGILPPNLFANKFERFQIFIGDVWESDSWRRSTTLNTLWLKLTPNNQSDQGLKRLMMSSEDLGLDVTEGVGNILFQWDNEGFQHLKRLLLRNNVVDITYIINRKVVLPNLTTLIISKCDHLRFMFSCSMATSFVALKHLKISECEIMEEVVSSKTDYNEENMNTMFCKLETLKFDQLPSLDRICTGTRLEFLALKKLKIEECKKLKAFMCGPMSENSSRICKEIEEGELEERPSVKSDCRAQSFLFDDKVIFPCLEVLRIRDLEDLETIWYNNQIVNPNSFCRLNEVRVSGCKSLISIFPPGIMGRLNALKSLSIESCKAVEMVFGVGGSDVKETHVITFSPTDQLKPLYCRNLEVLHIYGADSLKNIMPASLALGLLRLRYLYVNSCYNLLEIVGEEEEEEEEGVELPTPPHFVFPNATSVELSRLPQLKSFYPGKHTSEWPLLETLWVGPISSVIFQDKDEGGAVKSLFQIDKDSFPNLEELKVYGTEIWYGSSPVPPQCFSKLKKITFYGCAPFSQQATSLFLQQLHNITAIEVNEVSSAPPEEIFFNDGNSSSEEIHVVGSLPSVTTLHLSYCEMLHLGKENSGSVRPIFPNLDVLGVAACHGLKNLESSVISFRNLTTLKVSDCEGLEHLITYSVAKSLMHLTTMQVTGCPRLAVLVTTDGDDAAEEITFRQLQHLHLSELPYLKRFCSGNCIVKVPSLTSLSVTDCDKVRISNNNGKLWIINKVNMKMVVEGNEDDEIGVVTEDYVSFDSRNSIVRKIIDELRSPSADVILVYGVGGVGKTTLVEEVFRQVLKAKLFIDAVMVRDVKVPNLEAIQKEIAEKLGLTVSSDQTIPERADSICERIKQKSTLVILDDLWREIDFKALGLPHIPTCKIVLTSRFRKLLSSANIKQKEFLLGALDENETWLLFKKKAGDVTNDPVIQKVATQVAGRCRGLPVLVITVARTLEDGPLAMWEDTLRCLASFDEKEDLTSKAYLGLEWSYTQLNEQLKPLFLLCGTTIQGNSVSLTNLLKYSMGLGFFKRLTVKEARDALYTRVDKLKSYCLLLDGDDDTCVRMDDLVHDVALRIATRDQHVLVKDGDDQLIEWPDQDSFERCRKIITRSCNIPNFPEAPWKCRELEMFLLHGNENDHRFKIPDKLFDEMQKLKVLGFYNLLITLLPPSLELLKISLQTLCLDGCTLEDIALVGELSSLETLSFANSKVKELPKEIARLTRLRLLDLSDCHMLKVISPNVISSLTRLEDLRMRNSFETWEAEGDINERRNASLLELKQLPKLTALEIYIPDVGILPPNLFANKFERFQIFIGDVWESDSWRRSTTLNTLWLKLTPNNQSDQGLKRLMMSSEDLGLDVTEGVGNILFQWDNEGFQHLKRLLLRNNVVDITYIINRKVVLPNLTTLIISKCDHLRFMFSCSMATSFVALKHLKISECEIMEEVVSSKTDYNEENMNTMFCKLETLKLDQLPSLDRICTGTRLEFLALKKLKIEECKKLKAFMCGPMSENSSRICKEIEEGELEERPSVKSDCRAQSFLFDDKVIFPCLEVLRIRDLEDLETIWYNNQIVNPNSFCRLKKVEIRSCKRLISIFPSGIMGRLNALKSLTIFGCMAVGVVFRVGESDVKETRVNTLSHSDQLKYCHNLEVLDISGAGSLKNIMPASLALGLLRLRYLNVNNCYNLLEIVGEEGVELPTPPHFVFPNATRVILRDLPQLKSFYPGKHTSEWPLLEWLEVGPIASVSVIFQDKDEGGAVKSLFQIDKVVLPNLTTLIISKCDHLRFLFSCSMATSFVALKHLKISACKIMEEVVSSTRDYNEENMNTMFRKLETLELDQLPSLDRICTGTRLEFLALKKLKIERCKKLKAFMCGPMSDNNSEEEEGVELPTPPHFVFPNATRVILRDLPQLKSFYPGKHTLEWPLLETLWVGPIASGIFQDKDEGGAVKSLFQINKVVLPNLTTLIISKCDHLRFLFSCSMATSFVALKHLKISACKIMEEVVSSTRDYNEENMNTMFRKLETLELDQLPSLDRICTGTRLEFLALKKLKIERCKKLKAFMCGPMSDNNSRICKEIEEGELEESPSVKSECRAQSCLFDDTVIFPCLEVLRIRDLEDLETIWYNNQIVNPNSFCRLKKVEIRSCKRLISIFPSGIMGRLNALKSLTIFGCMAVGVGESDVKETRVNTLSHSDQLKYCHNLEVLDISGAGSLKNIMPASLALGLLRLRYLNVNNCYNLLEIVGEEGVELPTPPHFVFPNATRVILRDLPQLKSFYPGKHTSEWPLLERLEVGPIASVSVIFQDKDEGGAVKSLFQIDKAVLNLEQDSEQNLDVINKLNTAECFCFNGKKANTFAAKFSGLWKTHDTGNLCPQVKQYSVLFEKSLFPKLEDLTFCPKDIWYGPPAHGKKALFPATSIDGSLPHLKKLRLHGMEKFMRLWENTEPASGSAFPQMDTLEVKFLGLTNLELSAISFRNLTTLEVTYCWRLQYLTTYSVAKSLEQLNTLKVDECKNMKEIFTSEGMEEDEREYQIVLYRLQHLELSDLISLERFCWSNCSVKVPMLGPVKMDWCPFKLKVSPDKLLEVEVSHTIECASGLETNHGSRLPGITRSEHEVEAEIQEDPIDSQNIGHVTDTGKIANEGEQLELKRLDDVQQDIRRLEKELRAKQEEMREIAKAVCVS